jgi:dienelactone hydrolase
MKSQGYDPFARGRFPVGAQTIDTFDSVRNRSFPCEIWYPASQQHVGQDLTINTQDTFTDPRHNTLRSQMAVRNAAARPGTYALIVFSHASRHHRRGATFLCTHLSSHGYVVAAFDHSEVVSAELAPSEGETAEQKAARINAIIASRVPDVRFLLDHLLCSPRLGPEISLDPGQIGIVGHSFGGWTALAAPDVEERIRSVVALAPGGGSHPKPGILPLKLGFNWGRDVPTLFLVAENDVSLPLAGICEQFERTPATKQMVILRRADHEHFMDNVEQEHESFRTAALGEDMFRIQQEMLPITELCSGAQAHLFIRGLTLCHMDVILRRSEEARRFLTGDIAAELGLRGVDVIAYQPSGS